MRKLTDHIVTGDSANHQVSIAVLDGPGQGGACHEYRVAWADLTGAPREVDIHFQNGPIKEYGVNGLTHEALLAIVIDRLRSFQAGPYACEANDVALVNIQTALISLQLRTRERIARGVEGTHQK